MALKRGLEGWAGFHLEGMDGKGIPDDGTAWHR